jgi:hypothetical protein
VSADKSEWRGDENVGEDVVTLSRNVPENATRAALDMLSKWEPISLTTNALAGDA